MCWLRSASKKTEFKPTHEISGRLWVIISMQHFAPSSLSECVCVIRFSLLLHLQNRLSTRVAKVSMQLSVKVSVHSRWRQVMRGVRVSEVVVSVLVVGVEVRLLVVWLHLDADHGLAWRQVRRRVLGDKARLGVGRWGGAGDLQVQSDAEEQWGEPARLHFDSHTAHTYTQFTVY